MHISDLKRAVEDVVLRPDSNRLSDLGKRSTIAALDLCQVRHTQSTSPLNPARGQMPRQRTITVLTSSSCSGELFASSTESTCSTSVTTSSGNVLSAPPLSMSTSLDTMVLRQTLLNRPSLIMSRRSSRVLPHHSHSKRKRSNSVSSCMNKGILTQHSIVSTAGVSATVTGGASALSLPPTARHTPFRFDEHFSTRSISGGNPSSVLYTPSLTESLSGIRMQKLPADEWTRMCGARETDYGWQYSGGFEGGLTGGQQSTGDFGPALFSLKSFSTFREAPKAYDADNEEQMECD